jgi:hypothetical protein
MLGHNQALFLKFHGRYRAALLNGQKRKRLFFLSLLFFGRVNLSEQICQLKFAFHPLYGSFAKPVFALTKTTE